MNINDLFANNLLEKCSLRMAFSRHLRDCLCQQIQTICHTKQIADSKRSFHANAIDICQLQLHATPANNKSQYKIFFRYYCYLKMHSKYVYATTMIDNSLKSCERQKNKQYLNIGVFHSNSKPFTRRAISQREYL